MVSLVVAIPHAIPLRTVARHDSTPQGKVSTFLLISYFSIHRVSVAPKTRAAPFTLPPEASRASSTTSVVYSDVDLARPRLAPRRVLAGFQYAADVPGPRWLPSSSRNPLPHLSH
jgi:hypothetical protein